MLTIEKTALSDVLIPTLRRFGDKHGFLCEAWNKARMAAHAHYFDIVQDKHSLSTTVSILRTSWEASALGRNFLPAKLPSGSRVGLHKILTELEGAAPQ
jgi:hypothetical protein